MSVEYLELADHVGIAAAVTGLDEGLITKVAELDLADSALHAPAAGFGDDDFYPDLVDKAAVLIVRLARNHPLPDGKQASRVGGAPVLPRLERVDVGRGAERR